jgi:3-deoxy-D-manno-octulosonate 8-phosphate phosphatase (KDO 8-P phosphatase)
LSYQDLDAVFHWRRQGLELVLITGENTPWVEMIGRRLEIKHVYRGAKDKPQALRQMCRDLGVTLDHVCYVGDSLRDAEALAIAGLGLAPADASRAAQAAADRVLKSNGGNGAVAEAVEMLLQKPGPVFGERSPGQDQTA